MAVKYETRSHETMSCEKGCCNLEPDELREPFHDVYTTRIFGDCLAVTPILKYLLKMEKANLKLIASFPDDESQAVAKQRASDVEVLEFAVRRLAGAM